MNGFAAGVDGVTLESQGCRLLGVLYRGAGPSPRPTAILLHGLPGIEKHLDIAYRLRDLGWNALLFHPRGSWGSGGTYSLAGLDLDLRAALDWTRRQPSVDPDRIALLGGSTGGYVALRLGASDPRIGAIVALSPFIDPREFDFPTEMAGEFAGMLSGVTGAELRAQWRDLEPLTDKFPNLYSKSLLLVSGDRDELTPPSHYGAAVAALPNLEWIRHPEGDHSFSSCRPWLVDAVTVWLDARLGT